MHYVYKLFAKRVHWVADAFSVPFHVASHIHVCAFLAVLWLSDFHLATYPAFPAVLTRHCLVDCFLWHTIPPTGVALTACSSFLVSHGLWHQKSTV